VKAGADFEQTQVAFATMIGSAEKANALLKEMASFASRTPFQLADLEKATKSLLAYGVAVDDVIPTLTTLGDIAAGVGMDKLPQLILAFGQVKAATKLTGAELRQFTEAGVPLLEALVNQFNKTGKAMGGVSNAAGLTTKQVDKLGKANAALAEKIRKAELQLEKQNNRMKEMRRNNKDSGASYKNLKLDIEETERTLALLNSQLASGNGTMALANQQVISFGENASYTAAQVMEMISNGEVSFAEVQAALQGMTSEGGKFFGLMASQATTLGGLWSNLQDQFTLTARSIGTELLPVVKPLVVQLIALMGWVQEFVREHPKLTAALVLAATAFAGITAVLLPLSMALPGLTIAFAALTPVLAGASVASLGVAATFLGMVALITAAVASLWIVYQNWEDLWGAFKVVVETVAYGIVGIFEWMGNFVIDVINGLIDQVNKLLKKLQSIPMIGDKFSGIKVEKLSRLDLTSSFDPVGSYSELIDNGKSRSLGEMLSGAGEVPADQFYGPVQPAQVAGPRIELKNNVFLDANSAKKMGDLMMQQLKLSSPI